LPFTQSSNDFWIIIGIMFLGTFSMIVFFKTKKWF